MPSTAETMGDQTTPDQMRRAAAQFIAAVHASYLGESAALTPADRARLSLLSAGPFSVAAVGTRYLHVIASTEDLAPLGPREASIEDSRPPLSWVTRFYDPVVLPSLGELDEAGGPAIGGVRRALGVRTVLYHYTRVFSAHQAAIGEFEAIRRLVPGQDDLISEMEAAGAAGLLRRTQYSVARSRPPTTSSPRSASRRRRNLNWYGGCSSPPSAVALPGTADDGPASGTRPGRGERGTGRPPVAGGAARAAIDPISGIRPDLTIDDAYAIQTRNIERRRAAGRVICGRKVGLTSRPMQEFLRVFEPTFGVLLDDMFVDDGDEIALEELIQPRVEAEIAFVLGRDLVGRGSPRVMR